MCFRAFAVMFIAPFFSIIQNVFLSGKSGIGAICWSIGAALKRTPHIADWTIPYLLLGIGIFISGLYVFVVDGVCPMSAFTAITQGTLLSIASVGGNQLVKQYGKKDEW